MRLAVLFSGGKDSTLAMLKAAEKEEVVCLITIASKNKESYMFHTPNIWIARLQAEAIGLPLIQKLTKGVKEQELEDLRNAIRQARKKLKIEGVVTGAVESVYQAERIQKICSDLDVWCFNPLWKKNQEELLKEILKNKFKVIISGIFAYPLDEKWLGSQIDEKTIDELIGLKERYGISPSGEGGEIETTTLDAPFFKKRIEPTETKTNYKDYSGTFEIEKARFVEK